MKIWLCTVCNYVHRGAEPPSKCPVCNAPASKFKEIDEASIPEKGPRRGKTDEKSNARPREKKSGGSSQQKKPASSQDIKSSRYDKITALLVKHHAHPVSVHVPNGVLPLAVFMWILAWIFNITLLSQAAFINIVFVLIALPFVIYTGILEWMNKYNRALTILFKLKIFAATLTATCCVISAAWYFINPDILTSPKAWGFMIVNIVMVASAGLAGFIGGKLVFKD